MVSKPTVLFLLYCKILRPLGHCKHEVVSNFIVSKLLKICLEFTLLTFSALLFSRVFLIFCGAVTMCVYGIPDESTIDIVKAEKIFSVSFLISFLRNLVSSWLLNNSSTLAHNFGEQVRFLSWNFKKSSNPLFCT